MEIDQELGKLGLRWITNFLYNVRDYLFDAITYLLNNSNLIWLKFMFHLEKCLRFEISEAL